MTCAEFKEAVALYAAGALPPTEAAQLEAHLEGPRHEGCFEALREALRGVEALAASLPPARPRDEVWRNIEKRLSPRGGRRVPASVALAASAAAVAIALSWLVSARARRQSDDAARQRELCLEQVRSLTGDEEAQREALSLLASPSSQFVTLAAPSDATQPLARAIVDPRTHRAVVVSTVLQPRSDRDYQVWVIRGQEPPRPGALLRGARGTALAQVAPALLERGADAIALSLEPPGGSPNGKPTQVLAVGPFPKS